MPIGLLSSIKQPVTRLAWVPVLASLVLAGVAPVQAQQVGSWISLGVPGRVTQVHVTPSGAVWALTETGLYWSSDGSPPFRPVRLPPPHPVTVGRLQVAFDPVNAAVLYSGGNGGIYKSTNLGQSWNLVYPTASKPLALAVSPANPGLLYAALTNAVGTSLTWVRSANGGMTWETLAEQNASLCTWDVPVLMPHPTNALRVFRAQICRAGRSLSGALEESRDRGTTWTSSYTPQMGFSEELAGGQGPRPSVFYLGVNVDPRALGPLLVRSDDDGWTWNTVHQFTGGAGDAFLPQNAGVRVGAVAYDPFAPDVVWAGFREEGRGVQVSFDGGHSWSPLGSPSTVGNVNSLALSIDANYLFAATDHGLWRYTR